MSSMACELPVAPRLAAHPSGRGALGATLLCAWMLMVCTFSLPDREGPESVTSVDAVALLKLAARGSTLAVVGLAVLWSPRDRRIGVLCWALLPFALFVVWGGLSCLWSPLWAVSVGQLAGLAAQLLIALGLGFACRSERDVSLVLRHLSLGLLLISALIVAVDMARPDLSGLDRSSMTEGVSNGLVHPTSAGATASLGVLILVASWLLWDWRWARALLVPGIAVHGVLLMLANSRMATALTVLLVVALAALLGRRQIVAAIGVLACVAFMLYLVVDPGLTLAGNLGEAARAYLQRGGTAEQFTTLTGRTELWSAVWSEFLKSPLIGHGYFVTSSTGLLDVWLIPANRDAHNVLLQVLVTTGIVGLALFLWGLMRPARAVFQHLRRHPQHRALLVLFVVVAAWYAAWGLLCSSFMGPVQPESVVFFAMSGLALSTLAREGRTAA